MIKMNIYDVFQRVCEAVSIERDSLRLRFSPDECLLLELGNLATWRGCVMVCR